ncbi:S-adenosyl-L-homocysteine hydrolase [Tribonema minus]|uniref:S-adenosyl-L-homocysteine hydrolase n=1 Tax=Tribonema minus TaxID=303371 RepID=A0A835Z6P1_9STRA|nr:S-adenosyl-L-homocysteine hydrolase [Tribonema minus]
MALAAGLRTLAGVELAGKTVVVCGFGEVGQACAAAVAAAGGRALVIEIDPICALQAAVDGYKVVTLEQALDAGATVFLTTTGVRATIGAPLMARMRDGSVVASVSHLDGEIELSALEREARRSALSEHASRYTFAATGASVVVVAEGRLLDLALARAPPQGWLAASTSLATQALALAELWRERSSGRYTRGTVSSMPRILDETAARLHLRGFGATLSSLTKEQSEYLRVAPEGPFKPYAYRY